MMEREPLLQPETDRLSLFPIRYPTIWNHYKRAFAAFWSVGEVDLSQDLHDWEHRLTEKERHFITMVLAFFASSDRIVNQNLAQRFGLEVKPYEAQCFYDLQKTMENVHSEMYSLLIQTYVQDPEKRDSLFHAVDHYDCVRDKTKWAQKWIQSQTATFAERLVAFAVVEGIFFSGSFCAIYWIKQRKMMPGLCASNTLIARDEGMHQDFAAMLYRTHLHSKLADDVIHSIVGDAVKHEVAFCCEALPVSLLGMNGSDMSTYIRFVADRLLVQLGHPKLYHDRNPFDWMTLISLEGKTNFFESRVTEYQKSGVRVDGSEGFDTTAEF